MSLAAVLVTALVSAVHVPVSAASSSTAPLPTQIDSGPAVHHDTSIPLRFIQPAAPQTTPSDEPPVRDQFLPQHPVATAAEAALQPRSPTRAAPSPTVNFNGVGQGFTGPAGNFTVSSAPPDPNSAVGPNHVVEIVNSAFAVFNKSGTAVYGPAQTNTLWSGFGGGCETNNDGDAVVRYDSIADRWIITQFSVATTPYLECFAVSRTADPTGSCYRYSFSHSNFPDYPKLGVGPTPITRPTTCSTARRSSGPRPARWTGRACCKA